MIPSFALSLNRMDMEETVNKLINTANHRFNNIYFYINYVEKFCTVERTM